MSYQISLVFLAFCWHLHVYLNDVNDALVVDEVYHVPQAQRYCAGNFSYWDAKITTPPGLYLLNAGVNYTLESLRGVDSCSLFGLRLTNVILLSIVPALLVGIMKAQQGELTLGDYLLAVTLPCLPVLFLTSFFYYTETLSVVLILALALFRYKKLHWLAALMGLASLTVRQTNVIWVGFFGADATLDAIIRFCRCYAKERKRDIDDVIVYPSLPKVLLGLFWNMSKKVKLSFIFNTLLVATPYILVLASFGIFLVWNGGIVVGDKEAHALSSHTPQLLYFCVFTAALSWPFVFAEFRQIFLSMTNVGTLSLFTLMCGIAYLVLDRNVKVHQYLLADNRHYSFYVWKKFLGKPWSKYLMAPLSAVCIRVVSCGVRGRGDVNFLTRIVLFLSIIVSLIFQELFDFRYFIIPFLVVRLHFPRVHGGWIFLEFLTYLLINAVTVYIYSTKTFRWTDLREPQRIIW